MDTDRFDALSRAIATAQPRRAAVIQVLGAGLALFAAAARDGEAKKKRRKKKKKKISCQENETRCGDACIDLLTDPANCGACGNMCVRDECIHGACACQGEIDCPEACGCASRRGSGAACRGNLTNTPCANDADCPVGAFCQVDDRCSTPCLA